MHTKERRLITLTFHYKLTLTIVIYIYKGKIKNNYIKIFYPCFKLFLLQTWPFIGKYYNYQTTYSFNFLLIQSYIIKIYYKSIFSMTQKISKYAVDSGNQVFYCQKQSYKYEKWGLKNKTMEMGYKRLGQVKCSSQIIFNQDTSLRGLFMDMIMQVMPTMPLRNLGQCRCCFSHGI